MGAEHVGVLRGAVQLIPVVLVRPAHPEPGVPLERVGEARSCRRRLVLEAGCRRAIHRVDRRRELAVLEHRDVPERGQDAVVVEQRARLRVPDPGIDPVPAVRGDDGRESRAGCHPVLEPVDDDVDVPERVAVPARDHGHRWVRLQRDEPAEARRQELRRLPGARADLEDPRRAGSGDRRDDVVDQLVRIGRSGSVIELCDLAEDECSLRPLVVAHAAWYGSREVASADRDRLAPRSMHWTSNQIGRRCFT